MNKQSTLTRRLKPDLTQRERIGENRGRLTLPSCTTHYTIHRRSYPAGSCRQNNEPRAVGASQHDPALLETGTGRGTGIEQWDSDDGRVRSVVPCFVNAKERAGVLSSLQSPSNGYRVDPFNCIPGSGFGCASLAIDYLTQCVMPVTAQINSIFGVNNPVARGLLEAMAFSDIVFHAAVAIMVQCHPCTSIGDATAIGHKAVAITKLRAILCQPFVKLDVSIILGIILLALDEAVWGNPSTYAMHLKHVRRMLRSIDGAILLQENKALRLVLMHFGVLNAHDLSMTDIPGPVPRTNSDQVAQSNARSREQMLWPSIPSIVHSLPLGFQRLAQQGCLSHQTISAIAFFAKDNCWLTDGIPDQLHTYTSFAEACPALMPTPAPLGTGQTSVERMISLGLIRFSWNRIYDSQPGNRLHEGAATFLCKTLSSITIPNSHQRDVFLWIWLVLVDTFSLGLSPGTLSPDGVALLGSLLKRFPETYSWNSTHFESFGKAFLWRDGMRLWLERYWRPPKGKQTQFISVGMNSSQRERELNLSQIRQHAAQASHRPPGSKDPSKIGGVKERQPTSQSTTRNENTRGVGNDVQQGVDSTLSDLAKQATEGIQNTENSAWIPPDCVGGGWAPLPFILANIQPGILMKTA